MPDHMGSGSRLAGFQAFERVLLNRPRLWRKFERRCTLADACNERTICTGATNKQVVHVTYTRRLETGQDTGYLPNKGQSGCVQHASAHEKLFQPSTCTRMDADMLTPVSLWDKRAHMHMHAWSNVCACTLKHLHAQAYIHAPAHAYSHAPGIMNGRHKHVCMQLRMHLHMPSYMPA